jgi:asparagine N-glycosylation enzyme membrane subunit Stt3
MDDGARTFGHMLTPPIQELSLAGALVTLFAFVAPEPLVHLMAVYSIVMLGWIFGLFIGLLRRPPDGYRYPIVLYGVTTLLANLGLAVPLAAWLSTLPWLTDFGAQALVFPVAALIPALAPDWPKIWAFVSAEIGGRGKAIFKTIFTSKGGRK